MFWLVSYDVVDNRRRYRVRRTLEGYGRRVQYSVFECELETDRWKRLVDTLTRLINHKEDSIRFYPLSKIEVERRHLLGTGSLDLRADVVYLDEDYRHPF